MTDSEGNEIGKLFVGGLSQATNNGSLRIYFSRFGEVDDAVVMMDNKTGRSRGFGYVKYRDPESVNLALDAKPHVLDGKEVDAKQCNVNMKGRNRRSLKIFVGGIGLDQDAESIRTFFHQFGRVTDVNLMMDSNKQRHRGFAFVGFEDESVVKRLIGLHYVMMSNKQVEIKAMEPPNFGRKIGPHACLATAALMANASQGDSACTLDTSHESGGMLPAGAQFTNHISYLAPQSPGLSCITSNMLAAARANSGSLFEASPGSFDNSLENLYQTAGFLQPVNHTTGSGENVQPGVPVNPYLMPKQAIPLLAANGQYNSSTSGSLARLQQTSSSLYAPIPYQIISPTFISPSTQQPALAGLNQILGTGKSAPNCWPPSALQTSHLTFCSSQITSANNIVACQQPTPIPNLTAADATGGGIAPIVAPYYALCPQYTAISLAPDQPVCPSYTFQTPSGMLSTNLASCNPNGTGDTAGSRPCSPANDTRVEASSLGGSTPKVVYPTLLMTGPSNLQNSTPVISPQSHAMPLGQNLWNQTHPSLFYSSVPVGWTIQPNPSQTPASHGFSTPTGLISQQHTNAISSSISTKTVGTPTRRSEEAQPGVQENTNGIRQPLTDDTKLASTQAAGDNVDSMSREQHAPGLSQYDHKLSGQVTSTSSSSTTAEFKCSKPQTETKQTEKWQVGDSLRNLFPSSWSSISGSPNTGRWDESNKLQMKFGCPKGQLHANPWNLPAPDNSQASAEKTPITTNSTLPTSPDVQTQGISGTPDSASHRMPIRYQASQVKAAGHHPTAPSQPSGTSGQRLSSGRSSLLFETDVQPKLTNTARVATCGATEAFCDSIARLDCAHWGVYAKPTATGHTTESSTGDTKELSNSGNVDMELECQGPAGAAGDFHLPETPAQYSGYRATQ